MTPCRRIAPRAAPASARRARCTLSLRCCGILYSQYCFMCWRRAWYRFRAITKNRYIFVVGWFLQRFHHVAQRHHHITGTWWRETIHTCSCTLTEHVSFTMCTYKHDNSKTTRTIRIRTCSAARNNSHVCTAAAGLTDVMRPCSIMSPKSTAVVLSSR